MPDFTGQYLQFFSSKVDKIEIILGTWDGAKRLNEGSSARELFNLFVQEVTEDEVEGAGFVMRYTQAPRIEFDHLDRELFQRRLLTRLDRWLLRFQPPVT